MSQRNADYDRRTARALGVSVEQIKALDEEFNRSSFPGDVAALKSDLMKVIRQCHAEDTPRVVLAALFDLAIAVAFSTWGRAQARRMLLGALEVAEPIPGEQPLFSHDA